MTRFVLVHGACHGAWCWDRLVPILHEMGHRTEAVDLPSSGAGGDLAADAEVVRDSIERSSEPTVVVAHSYGGQPVTQATAGLSQVRHLVYISAVLLDVVTSRSEVADSEPASWWVLDRESGTVTARNPREVFYSDLDEATAAHFTARLKPQTAKTFSDQLTAAGWHDIPSTYVVCTRDRAIPPATQRMMATRAGAVVELDSGHTPFASQPSTVADILVSAGRAVRVDPTGALGVGRGGSTSSTR